MVAHREEQGRTGQDRSDSHCHHQTYVSLKTEERIECHADRLAICSRQDACKNHFDPRKHEAEKCGNCDARSNLGHEDIPYKLWARIAVEKCGFIHLPGYGRDEAL